MVDGGATGVYLCLLHNMIRKQWAGSPSPLITGRPCQCWLSYYVLDLRYGHVYHARSKATGKRVAIKQFKAGRDGDGLSHTAIREIMLLRELSHENIVRLDR
jgi:hypothetical protein